MNKIERFEQEHEKFDHVPHVVIVGAGAAGVELAFAFKYVLVVAYVYLMKLLSKGINWLMYVVQR